MSLFLIFQRAWFGGDFASIIGECACPRGMVFDQREMYCRQNFMGSTIGLVVIGICVLVGLCCCCGCLFMANKMRGWRKTTCWGWYRCKITRLLDRMMTISAFHAVHFKKTVAQSSFLSRVLSFLLKSKQSQRKWQHFWMK